MFQESELEKVKERLHKFALNYADKNNYLVNQDKASFEQLIEEMAKNKIEFGAQYCPCMTKRISGDREADKKLICPCVWHKEDIESKGNCFCNLFFKSSEVSL